jgi:cellulase (glycosyl hydrolase family 5)
MRLHPSIERPSCPRSRAHSARLIVALAATSAACGMNDPGHQAEKHAQASVIDADSPQIVLTRSSGGSITDAFGNVWTLTPWGDIEENGSPVPGGGGTSALTYVASTQTIWGQDAASGQWYSWTGTSWDGPTSDDPVGSAAPPSDSAPAPEQIVLTPSSGGSITDASGNVWTLTASGDVEESGSPVPGGGGTAALTYVASTQTIWGQDASSGQWYSWSGSGWVGPTSTSPISGSPNPPPPSSTPPSSSPPSPPPASPSPSSGLFVARGGAIIDPNGGPFIARGINAYYDVFSTVVTNFSSGDPLTSTFPGLNFVRMNIFNNDLGGGPGALEPYVNALTNLGIVVEIEYHEYPTTLSGSMLDDVARWYSDMASRFNGNPYVWFGSQNEPGDAWAVSTMHRTIYDAIRSVGNNTIIMHDLVGGWTTNGLDASAYSSMQNIVWDVHFYNWISSYSTDSGANVSSLSSEIGAAEGITGADGTIPIIVGEFGDSTDGNNRDPGWSAVVQAVCDSGHGFAAWAWNGWGGADWLLGPPFTGGQSQLTDFGRMVASCIARR